VLRFTRKQRMMLCMWAELSSPHFQEHASVCRSFLLSYQQGCKRFVCCLVGKCVQGLGSVVSLESVSVYRGLFVLAFTIFQLMRLKPSVVVGMGGPDAWITGFAAYLARKPVVVIEPNVMPSSTARNLAHMARLVFTAFRVPMDYLRPDKCALLLSYGGFF
jgi:hypothetical protein